MKTVLNNVWPGWRYSPPPLPAHALKLKWLPHTSQNIMRRRPAGMWNIKYEHLRTVFVQRKDWSYKQFHSVYIHTFTYTYLSCHLLQHLGNWTITVLFWGKTAFSLPDVGAMLPLPPCLACPGFCYQHVVCSNGSDITPTVPLQLYTSLNTPIQINIMGVRHYMQYIYTQFTSFFMFFNLTSKQVS